MKKSSIHSPIFLILSIALLSANSIHIPTLKETQVLDQISQAFTLIYESTNPAVISIKAQSNVNETYGAHNPFEFHSEIFNRFFGQMPQPSPQKNAGSGFFCSTDGHIMTNAHVVNNCDKITIVLHDGQEVDAVLVGSDPHTDIALLKIESKEIAGLSYLPLGDSDSVKIGELAFAIGSPLLLKSTFTQGIISAKGRQNLHINDLEDFIQSTVQINRGNSGGPLLNSKGEVIGINTAIASNSGGYMGISFSIPINMAKNIMNQLLEKGSVTRGFLGVTLQPMDADIAKAFGLAKPEGALISEVVPGSAADKAGLKQGDIVLEYDNKPVKSSEGLKTEISLKSPGSTIQLKVKRNQETKQISVKLGSNSDNVMAENGIVQKLGLQVEALTEDYAKQLGYKPTEEGVVITKVKPNSPAAIAGLRPGCLIQNINYKKVTNLLEFNQAINQNTTKSILLLVRDRNRGAYFCSIQLK
ncbi:Do family serine endopeptidase [Candidatus Rhabdochlamydia porcellionis]|jgi:serine protease Do|uniref:Periplasmic serine endoprotease DegP-like n=1 Tax=Candidatus Rhabdochlamydia porcellionis TaxID=225148 RepID=A0ABX8YYW1_9BACT|nr:Do family serine endopeptidase [Candidatus Rhabdochlamydia porcellionis]QZA58531.1 Periplasmic pH-dependent serine endoprotease DegQ [Candidatus Rhabdochlamydia porcellionis]